MITILKILYRLCPLRLMTATAKKDVENLIDELRPGGGTNVLAGLREALKVLNDRYYDCTWEAAILAISCGTRRRHSDDDDNAEEAPIDNVVPVYMIALLGNQHHLEVYISDI